MKEKRKKEHVLLYKTLYSLSILFLYMLGRHIPLYGIDYSAYKNVEVDAQSVLVQFLSGDRSNCSIFIIGLWPYMLSQMAVMLVVAIIRLDSSRRISPRHINVWNIAMMAVIAIFQIADKVQTLIYASTGYEKLFAQAVDAVELFTGMLVIVYLCDRATKYGIGGRMAIFLVNIVDGIMTMFTAVEPEQLKIPIIIGCVGVMAMLILETTEKHIPVQRVSIHNIHADKNYIAYKLSLVGVMPMMFVSVFFLLPQLILNLLSHHFPENETLAWWSANMTLNSEIGICVYLAILAILTIAFSFILLSPGRTADDLMHTGDSLENIYAGKPTRKYLRRCVLRFSIITSVVMCVFQGLPLFLQFGGYVDKSISMLPSSIMMSTCIWISFYREGQIYRNMDRYKPFI